MTMAFKENLENIHAISSPHNVVWRHLVVSAAGRYLLLNLTCFPLWGATTAALSLRG